MSLIRLAILGGVGYLIYRMVSELPESATARSQEPRGGERAGTASFMGSAASSGTPPLSGPGQGMETEVAEGGGGFSRQRVGRGVVEE